MSDVESSFLVDDSDEDSSPQWTKKNSRSKSDRLPQTIPDSDDEFLNDDDEDTENEDDNEPGRMTPSIRKAIRRSIMNMSRQFSESDNDNDDDEDEDEDDEDEADASQRSQNIEDSESEEETIQRVKKNRIHQIVDDSSDEEEEIPRKSTSRGNTRKSRGKSFNGSQLSGRLDEIRDTDEEEEEESEKQSKNSSKSRKFADLLDSSEEDEEIANKSKNHSKSQNVDDIPKEESEKQSNNSSKSRQFADLLDSSEDDEEVAHKSQNHSKSQNGDDILDETTEDFKSLMNKSKNSSKNQNFDHILDETSEDPEDSGRGSHPANKSSSFSKKAPGSARKSKKLQESANRHSESIVFTDESSEEGLQKKLPPKKPVQTANFLDSEEEVEEVQPAARKSAEVISIDSDTPSDASVEDKSHEKSKGEIAAMSFAQEELGLNKIDPLVAQKRALIVFELKKAENELARLNVFLKEGQIQYLPDQGQRLIETAHQKTAEVENLRKQLAECRLVEKHSPEEIRDKFSKPQTSKHVSPMHDDTYEYSSGSEAEEVEDPVEKPFTFNDTLLKRPTTKPMDEMGKKALQTFEREQALTVETLKTFHGSLHSRPAENEQAEDPKGLKVKLLPHQKHALAWLLWRESQKPPGGVLADDMGLGKTLTMISLVLKMNEDRNSGDESEDEWYAKNKSSRHLGGTLVICPASLIGQWEEEVNRRVKKGLLNVELYHGNKRESVPKRLARNDMVITTYNLVSREHKVRGVLFKVDWKRVILDEGHVIRNHKSQVCEAVCALVAKKRWVLTGTPIHNKEMDLYSILKFLECAPFNDIRVWKRWVDNKNQAGHERLAAVMKTLMLRRTKQELMNSGALDNLPEKNYEEILVNLDREERDVYEKVMLYSKTIFAQFLHQRAEKQHMFAMGAGSYDQPYVRKDNPFNKAQQKLLSQHADVKSHQILTLLLRLRQICIHPSLINAMLDQEDLEANGIEGMGGENDLTQKMNKLAIRNGHHEDDEDVPDGPAEVSDRVSEHLLTSDNPVFDRKRESSKQRALLDLLKNILKTTKDKVIVVSQWTASLNIVAESLANVKGASFKSLTGAIQVKDRGSIVDSFNNDKDPRILLLSLTAGGVGLNLVGANHLVLIDNHWNPQLESQAQDRIYRFGQKKNVFIYKLLCHDTIEERIKAMQEKKLELAKNVLSGSGKITSSKLSLDELKSLFGM